MQSTFVVLLLQTHSPSPDAPTLENKKPKSTRRPNQLWKKHVISAVSEISYC